MVTITKSTNLVIRKSNKLIESRTKLSIAEQRLILYLLSQIQPSDKDFKIYKIPLKEFAKMIGKSKSTVYEAAKEVTKELMTRVMTLNTPEGPLQVAWISHALYIEQQGYVELGISPKLKPYLLELKSCFTQYALKEVIQFSNQYSWRIYELCKQYAYIGERIITVDDLRKYLDLDTKYTVYGNIKKRILEPTAKEINSKTSLRITYEEIKRQGRKVEAIKYTIKSANQNIEETGNKHENNILDLKKYFKDEVLNELIMKYGQERCLKYYSILQENLANGININNPGGWLKTAIEEDYYSLYDSVKNTYETNETETERNLFNYDNSIAEIQRKCMEYSKEAKNRKTQV